MHTRHGEFENPSSASDPMVFPTDPAPAPEAPASKRNAFALAGLPESAEQVYEAIECMSRRLEDLARELNCLGHFIDEDDDGPRAA